MSTNLSSINLYQTNKYVSCPHFKIIFLCNQIPFQEQNEHAIRRKITIIQFPESFQETTDILD